MTYKISLSFSVFFLKTTLLLHTVTAGKGISVTGYAVVRIVVTVGLDSYLKIYGKHYFHNKKIQPNTNKIWSHFSS